MKSLFVTLSLVFTAYQATAQDYIVTWNNDTIPCIMPPKPAKEGLRPSYRYENGYEKFAAIISKDSMRIIEAGQVKSYSRGKHGKGLLCNGIFDAKKIAGDTRKEIGLLKKDEQWFFMQRVSTGPYAKLYIQYSKASDGCIVPNYYFSFASDNHDGVVYIGSKKSALKLLMKDAAIAPQLEKLQYRKSLKGYIDIIEAYNRLKQEAESKLN